VEALMADTGERPTAWEAAGGRIEADPEALARALKEKAPVWAPREEWTALEARARADGTVLFLVEGYGDLIERTRLLARTPDLPAPVREIADGLLAYDRACREEGRAADELLGLIAEHAERRRDLDAAAVDRPVAGLAEYGAWRGMADGLAANGPAVLAHPAIRSATAAARIAPRLERLSGLLDLDDAVLAFETLRAEVAARAKEAGTIPFHVEGHGELVGQARTLAERPLLPAWLRPVVDATVADAETREGLCAGIRALHAGTAALLEERRALEAAAGLDPPSTLHAHAGWRERCEQAERSWRAMRDDPETWKPHLDALKEEAAAIGTAIDRFVALRDHDTAWANLSETRKAILEEAGRRDCLPFDLEGWDSLVGKAHAIADTPDVPNGAKQAAERVLDEDGFFREARAEIGGFLDGAARHGAFWESLRQEADRRAGAAIAMIDLPAYRPLAAAELALRRTGQAILDDEARYGPHLHRMPEGRETVARALARLDTHAVCDRCSEALIELAQAELDAVGRGVALSRDGGCRKAQQDVRRLARRDELDEAMRDRLAAELAAQADRAGVWLELLQLAREMEALAREYEAVCAEAAGQDVPRPLLPEWRGWEERARTFVHDATWALRDADLLEGWEELTDLPARVGEELERVEERIRLPAHEEARLERMLEAETARLRDPDAGHEYEHDWWGQEPLAAGDRLELSQRRDGPGREAVVIWPGVEGGRARDAKVALEWAGAEGSAEWVAARELAGSGVRRASWIDERLREAALARGAAAESPHLPHDCRNGLATGDRVRWTEIVPPRAAREGAPAGMGRAMAVTVEAELVERSIGPREEEDRCRLRQTWRSDGAAVRQVDVSFGLLMAGGAMCAFGGDREKRERELREQEEKRRIERERALEREQAERQRFLAMRQSMRLR
ncbi:MAG: hypothetical protein OYH76_14390, partial [Defluviicoccus sp.]|nr:hypothetical protein [Defluviicoccus sp.]